MPSFRKRNSFVLLVLASGIFLFYQVFKFRFAQEEKKIDRQEGAPRTEKPEAEAIDESMPEEDLIAARQIHAAFATGDYGRCLDLAEQFERQAHRSPLFKKWLRRQMESILIAEGLLKLKTGRCDRAIDLFNRAEKIHKALEVGKGLA